MKAEDIALALVFGGEGGGGTEQVQSDWNQTDTTAKDFIKNKPTIPAETPIATTEVAGKVKPDGTTTTVDSNGVLSAIASGGDNVFEVVDGVTLSADLIDAWNNGKICYIRQSNVINICFSHDGTKYIFNRLGINANAPDTLYYGYNIVETSGTTVRRVGLNSYELVDKTDIATSSNTGLVKPDGTTITVDGNGKISAVIPACTESTDGTYTLQATVANGVVTYNWVSST